ncbi:TPA: NUDIX hydrolase [Candidatus Gracilibacteria bacterium]|nr:NUDIX hydrolase [Candidatus Peregrinibacteria bacterium]HIQ56750.1 NUDIX hydrolase [Candidatus Gracilibacteria bacterium]HIQ57118.1 NUDIX hydrolase [Candidatus Gracilibacteria bacterium]
MRIAVRALIFNEKGELLVVQHRKSDFWALPGGKIEESLKEDLQSCIKREILEELGVEISVQNLLFIQEFQWGNTRQEAKENDVTIEFFFAAKIINTKKNIELSEIKFAGEFAEKELNKIAWKKLDANLNIKPDFLKNYTIESIEKMNTENKIEYFSLV